MKILLAIFLSVLFAVPLQGQRRILKHLYGDKGKDISPMLSPTIQLTELLKDLKLVPGLKAGVIFNKNITFGAVYNYTVKDQQLPAFKGTGSMGMKWGGLLFEYTLWPLQNVHLTLPLSVGMGQLNLTDTISVPGERITSSPSFIFVEPGLALEFNIWKYAKFDIGGGYRYTNNATKLIKAYDLSGFSFNASVKFGLFNYEETKRERDRMKMLKELRSKQKMELRNDKLIEKRNEKLNKKINGPKNKKAKKRK